MPMRRWLMAALLDALAPEFCVFCGTRRAGNDWFRFPSGTLPGIRPWDVPHCCLACFGSGDGRVLTGEVAGWPLLTPQITSADLTAAVGQWKYHGLRGVGAPLACWLAPVLAAAAERHGGRVVVPVPLHRTRRRERGFDQVAHLANLAAAVAGLPADDGILTRRRATGQQASRQTEGSSRADNVAGVRLPRRQTVRGARSRPRRRPGHHGGDPGGGGWLPDGGRLAGGELRGTGAGPAAGQWAGA